MPNFSGQFATSVLRTPPSVAGSLVARGRALLQDGRMLPWSSGGTAEAHNKLLSMGNSMATNPSVGGFAVPGGRTVAVNRNTLARFGGMPQREIIAHEAFHARNPVLGQSETLARFYGGYKGVPASGNIGAEGPLWAQRIGNGLMRVQQYIPQRPLYNWQRRSQYPGAVMESAPSMNAGADGWLSRMVRPAQRFFVRYGDSGDMGQAWKAFQKGTRERGFTGSLFLGKPIKITESPISAEEAAQFLRSK